MWSLDIAGLQEPGLQQHQGPSLTPIRRRGSTRALLPLNPRVAASPLRITLQDTAQNLPFSCIRFTHPWVFGNDGPRGTPILPLDIPAAEAQRVPHPSTWVSSEWQIQRTPPPVSWGFKDEEEAVHLFPTLPRLGRQEGHTASPTTSTLLGLQWWYWELQGGKGAPEKPPRALTFSVSS